MKITQHAMSAAALLTVLLPTGTWAQTAMNSFKELREAVTVGQKIVVTSESGRTIHGRIEKISLDSITVVDTRGSEILRDAPLRAFSKSDGLRNGIWLGVAAGGVAALLMAAPLESGYDVPPIWYAGYFSLFTVPAGAAIGALIDRAKPHKETRVRYGRSSTSRSLEASPLLNDGARGLSLSFRF